MTEKKDRERVMAEITISYVLRLANEQGCSVSREQARVFLNEEGRAYEMWKHMMQAGEDFIARRLLGQCISRECTSDGVSIHTLRRLLTGVAFLRRVPVGLFQFRVHRYPKE